MTLIKESIEGVHRGRVQENPCISGEKKQRWKAKKQILALKSMRPHPKTKFHSGEKKKQNFLKQNFSRGVGRHTLLQEKPQDPITHHWLDVIDTLVPDSSHISLFRWSVRVMKHVLTNPIHKTFQLLSWYDDDDDDMQKLFTVWSRNRSQLPRKNQALPTLFHSQCVFVSLHHHPEELLLIPPNAFTCTRVAGYEQQRGS